MRAFGGTNIAFWTRPASAGAEVCCQGKCVVRITLSTTKLDTSTTDLPPRSATPREPLGEARLADENSVAQTLRREAIYRRFLLTGDAVAAVLAVLVSAVAWQVTPRWTVLAVAPLVVVIAKIQGLYDRDERVINKSTLVEWRSICQATAIAGLVEYSVWTTLTSAHHGGGVREFVSLAVAGFVLTLLARVGARRAASAIASPEVCLIVGGSGDRVDLAAHIEGLDGVELAGMVEMSKLQDAATDLRAHVAELGVHRIVIMPDGRTSERATLELVRSAKAMGLRVSLFPTLLTAVGGCTVFDDLNGMTVLGVPRFGLTRSSRGLKRAFDLIGATLALVVAGPMMLLVALAIKIDSRGPALFTQTRVGRDGRHFTMFKFRSMIVGADSMQGGLADRNEAADGLFKMTCDPRVTGIGALLRRTHLDELPQLLNVVLGQMSLVGPRPLVVHEDELISGGDRVRLQLTPGITGPWQILGPMSSSLSEMAKLDYLYISNWSLWQDVDIIFKTAARVLGRHGH
ncbi:MAG: sugar transferase [Solirubrobacteraceae bacterium]